MAQTTGLKILPDLTCLLRASYKTIKTTVTTGLIFYKIVTISHLEDIITVETL